MQRLTQYSFDIIWLWRLEVPHGHGANFEESAGPCFLHLPFLCCLCVSLAYDPTSLPFLVTPSHPSVFLSSSLITAGTIENQRPMDTSKFLVPIATPWLLGLGYRHITRPVSCFPQTAFRSPHGLSLAVLWPHHSGTWDTQRW